MAYAAFLVNLWIITSQEDAGICGFFFLDALFPPHPKLFTSFHVFHHKNCIFFTFAQILGTYITSYGHSVGNLEIVCLGILEQRANGDLSIIFIKFIYHVFFMLFFSTMFPHDVTFISKLCSTKLLEKLQNKQKQSYIDKISLSF